MYACVMEVTIDGPKGTARLHKGLSPGLDPFPGLLVRICEPKEAQRLIDETAPFPDGTVIPLDFEVARVVAWPERRTFLLETDESFFHAEVETEEEEERLRRYWSLFGFVEAWDG